jgi:FixJ family two-component response regulator
MKDNVVFEALSLGASDFLYKPFPPQALINSINKIGTFVREEKS